MKNIPDINLDKIFEIRTNTSNIFYNPLRVRAKKIRLQKPEALFTPYEKYTHTKGRSILGNSKSPNVNFLFLEK
jgi:hypothetical protein